MTDYIKKDLERIIANASESDIEAPTWGEQKERLKAVQSADVAPVRHGYWKQDRGGKVSANCSICDSWMPFRMLPYCPNCGAKMDGDEHERV